MLLLIKPDDFKLNYIYFLEKKTNAIIDGFFTKICFSDECMIMNGISIDIPIQSFVKSLQYKSIQFDRELNTNLILQISIMEEELIGYYIKYYNVLNKTPIYSLNSVFSNGVIKYYKSITAKHKKYYMKISGVWETSDKVGLTYKLIEY
jgi:hypothetical protein